jgi:hypothetical protein
MPRLPTADDMGQRPVGSPKGGIAQLNLKTQQRGQEAQALVQFGQSLKGVGDSLARLAAKEKAELDAARAEETTSELLDKYLEFEYGSEGQEGFTQVLTGDAVKRKLAEEYKAKREETKKSLREGLANDDQKRAFDQRANVADRQFDARVYRHVAEQSRAYQGVVSEGVRATERRMAALNWDQPGQIELSILRTHMEVERKARLDGLDPERQGDRQVIDTLKVIAETQIHADVVDQMILTGKDSAAAAYYEAIKEKLTPEAIITLGSKVDASTTDGEAIRGADMAWEAAGPQEPNDPVRLDIMEKMLRERYASDPKVMKAAIQDLRSRAQAHDDGQREFAAGNQAQVLSAFHDGATLKDVQSMPEYWELDGEQRIKLRDYMTNAGWSEQQRARSEHEYIEGLKSKHGFRRYWELSNPRVLSTMSENQIWALEPELGLKLTSDLIANKAKLSSPAKVMEATIDTELFNTIASDAGLDPYKKNPDKEKLGRLRNEVEAIISEAQELKGGKLTRPEKEELMRKTVDRKVMVDEWGRDPSLPAAVVKPEQRAKVYVPIADVPPDWIKGAANYLRSTGQVPTEWSDDKIRQAMRGRIERAYGISITGGSSVDGRAALEGR